MDDFKSRYDGDFKKLNDRSFMRVVILVMVALVYLFMFLKVMILP